MKKLKLSTIPKNLILSEVWDLYLTKPDKDTPEWIVKVLDIFYPNYDRENLDIDDRLAKYREAQGVFMFFCGSIDNGR